MFSKHVSSLTSAYYHDELSPAESRRVAEHLIGCPRCRGEFEEIANEPINGTHKKFSSLC